MQTVFSSAMPDFARHEQSHGLLVLHISSTSIYKGMLTLSLYFIWQSPTLEQDLALQLTVQF